MPSIFDIIDKMNEAKLIANITPDIETQSNKQLASDIHLNEQQQDFINSTSLNKYGLLIGYAGTGKTTAVNQMLYSLSHNDDGELNEHMLMNGEERADCSHLSLPTRALNIAICAFTGMAVKQLKSKLFKQFGDYDMDLHCYTIHKLIDYAPEDEEFFDEVKQEYVSKRIFRPQKNEYNKLPFDIVIIDEISMVGEHLMKQLLAALNLKTCRIYAIGDIAQIPPIFSDSTMLPMLNNWPITELTTIYRQKDGSIIDNANRIRAGERPVFNEACKAHKINADRRKAQAQVVNHMKKEFEAGRYDPEKDIILCTNNQLQLGQELMNIQMRHIVNPNHKQIINVKTMRQVKQYAVGDRVMVTKNDAELSIFNGMIGVIKEIRVNANYEVGYRQNADLSGAVFADIESIMEEKEQEQINERKEIKMLKDMGLYDENAAKDKEEENDGTGKREASHNVIVSFPDEGDREVSFHTSTLIENLIPAWVITCHKSQGSGFRNVYIVLHDSGGQLLFNELFYTAFTRCQESVTLFTTELALTKAINNRRIKGNTLDEKLNWFNEKYQGGDFSYLPMNEVIKPTT